MRAQLQVTAAAGSGLLLFWPCGGQLLLENTVQTSQKVAVFSALLQSIRRVFAIGGVDGGQRWLIERLTYDEVLLMLYRGLPWLTNAGFSWSSAM